MSPMHADAMHDSITGPGLIAPMPAMPWTKGTYSNRTLRPSVPKAPVVAPAEAETIRVVQTCELAPAAHAAITVRLQPTNTASRKTVSRREMRERKSGVAPGQLGGNLFNRLVSLAEVRQVGLTLWSVSPELHTGPKHSDLRQARLRETNL